jgi:hypothetical protein
MFRYENGVFPSLDDVLLDVKCCTYYTNILLLVYLFSQN